MIPVASSVSVQVPLREPQMNADKRRFIVASSIQRKCLSNPSLEITISNIFNVASSVSAQVPLELFYLEIWCKILFRCILCFSASASQTVIVNASDGTYYCCILCFSASASQTARIFAELVKTKLYKALYFSINFLTGKLWIGL